MTAPPAAGPVRRARLKRIEFNPIAFDRSSRGTSDGMNA
jgi:hypothetical protein